MAKAKTGGLGRRMDDLFLDTRLDFDPISVIQAEAGEDAGEEQISSTGEKVVYISLDDIKPNSKQPRKTFNEDALNDLADSIKEYGVIQPVLVRPEDEGYELVAGERRWRAARKAGIKTIPAIVRKLTEEQNAFYALIENMQREDLNSIEEAQGIKEIMESFGLNQEEAAKVVGKSRSYVANSLRLLKLPEKIQSYVANGELSAGHAKAIAGLQGEELQLEAAEKAVEGGWSVRQIEGYTGLQQEKVRKPRKRNKTKAPEISELEDRIKEKVGTKVLIKGDAKKGRVILEYYSRDQLESLVDILLPE